MHLEEAFSLELQSAINAERAHELFWAKRLTDKRAFRCPGAGCQAQVTCANMDKADMDLIQQPHFRLFGTHAADCSLLAEVEQTVGAAGEGASSRAQSAAVSDEFVPTRPDDHFVREETAAAGPAGQGSGRSRGTGRSAERARRAQLFSVGSLVSRWLKARKAGEDRVRTLCVAGGEPVTYAAFFECIWRKRSEPLLPIERVYWGKASVRKLENGTGYRLNFDAPATHIAQLLEDGSRPVKPSFFVNEKTIEAYPLKDLLRRRLESAVHAGACIAFVYGAPKLNVRNPGTEKQATFINFDLTNLDMLALQPATLFEELRRPGGDSNAAKGEGNPR